MRLRGTIVLVLAAVLVLPASASARGKAGVAALRGDGRFLRPPDRRCSAPVPTLARTAPRRRRRPGHARRLALAPGAFPRALLEADWLVDRGPLRPAWEP